MKIYIFVPTRGGEIWLKTLKNKIFKKICFFGKEF